jgi:hypothetical protein
MAFYFGVGQPIATGSQWLLDGETQGFAIDATMEGGSVTVKDTTAPTNTIYNKFLNDSNLVQAGTSAKLVKWNADPYLRWSPHNIYNRSSEFDNAAWDKASGGSTATISANAIAAPDGSLTADKWVESTQTAASGITHRMNQTAQPAFVAGFYYTVSIYIKAAAGGRYLCFGGGGLHGATESPNFNPDAGTVTLGGTSTICKSATIEAVGNGWYRCSAVIAPSGGIIEFFLAAATTAHTFTAYNGDGSNGVYIWGAQISQGTVLHPYLPTTTVSRIGIAQQYDAARSLFGMYVEQSAINRILQSQAFDNASWTPIAGTVVANATTAPDGTTTADQITTTTTSFNINQTVTCVTLTDYTYSVFIKASTNTQWLFIRGTDNGTNGVRAWFDVLNGVAGTQAAHGSGWTAKGAGIESIGNGWYRCWNSFNTTGTTLVCDLRMADADLSTTGVSGAVVFLWGAQAELNISPSTYIPTTTATVTRSTDYIQLPVTTAPVTNCPLTVYCDLKRYYTNLMQRYIYIYIDSNNLLNCRYSFTGVNENCFVTLAGSVTVSGIDITPAKAVNTRYQITAAYATNDSGCSADGSVELTDTVCAMPTNLTLVNIGCANGIESLCGYIYRYIIVPARKPTATWRYNYV